MFDIDLYVALIYFLAAIPYAWMGLYAWRKRPAVAVAPFAWGMLCLSVWSTAYGLEILLQAPQAKMIASLFGYLGYTAIPVFLIFFALEFTGRSHLLTLRARIVLWGIPVLSWILAWTNSRHSLIWTDARVFEFNDLLFLGLRYSPLYWFFAFFSLSMTLGALFLLIAEMIQRPSDYRTQVSLIVLGILAPVASRIFYLTRMSAVSYLDITPLIALPVSLGLSWAITRRYRLQELLPLEHLIVLKNMQDGVIIADAYHRVVYINPVVENLLGISEAEAIGQPIYYVANTYGERLASCLDGGGQQRMELTFGDGSQSKTFEVTVSPVASPTLSVPVADKMLTLHDITRRKEAETTLSRRESIMSALRLAAEQFLKETTWEHNIPGVLEKIGESVDLSRVFVAMNYVDQEGLVYSSLCYEWASLSASAQIDNPALKHLPLRKAGMGRWEKVLSEGVPIFGLVRNMPESEREFFRAIGSLSIAAMPIFVNKQWWGFIMFDECRRERVWEENEMEALSIAASMFGSAEARARAELKLIRRQKSLDILHEIVLASLKAEDLLAMSETLVEKFSNLIHADKCTLALWDDGSKQEVQLATYERFQNESRARVTSPADQTLTEFVLNSGHTLVVKDADASFYEEQRIEKIPSAASVMALPLIAGKKKLGAVILSYSQPHHFQPEEISISEQASNLVSLALEKFQIVEQAERRATASETLRKASAAITETLQTEEAVSRVLEQLQQVVSYDSASVQLLRKNKLEIIGGSGFADIKSVLGVSFDIPGDNPNTHVIKTGKPYLLHEIGEVYSVFRIPPHNHIRSWLGVPLIFQERVIGLMAIDSSQPNHFTEEDINLATMYANQVAVTLENARIFAETQEMAITDVLTGTYNRRGLFQIGDFELVRARRTNRPFSLLMFDIDHFKRVNDHYGHSVGDQVLRGLAERSRINSRSVDVVCRYGGEEFVIFLPETNADVARMVAERLRHVVMDTPFTTDAGPLQITVSIGAAQANEHDVLKTLIERADHALYEAKRTGRNRVVVSSGKTHPLSQT